MLYIKKYWYVILIGIASVVGFILRAWLEKKPDAPIMPPIAPPKEVPKMTFVESLKQKKAETDAMIDKSSRKELINKLNDEYGKKPPSGPGPAA